VRIYTPPVQGQGGGLSTAEKAIYVYQRRAGDTTADLVMGAPGFSETFGVNSALDVGSVFNPWSAATCPATGRIFVSDGHSGRVLSWPGRQAYVNAQPADLVIGQPDLYLRERNSGMGLSVSARGLDNPDGLALDGVCNLYVADAMNSRVLRFPAPQTTGMAADLVIGQPDFTQDLPNRGLGAPAANTLAIPTGVTVTATGRLFIADRSNHRVTVYDPPLTNGVAASAVLGGQGVTSATTLNMPTNVAVDPAGNLFVADYYNHRVLRFSQPMATGKAADLVIGQSDMSSSSFGTTATALYYPYSMTVDPSGGLLLVADSKNHRVLRYDPPFQTGMAATGVFGQLGSLTNRLENLGGPPSADSMNYPSRLTMDQGRNLYIADTGNNRVLIFDTPLPFREFLPFILR
jgi:sugar lactone lactonase YvrE